MTAEIKQEPNLAIKNLIKCILFTRLYCLLISLVIIIYQRIATLK